MTDTATVQDLKTTITTMNAAFHRLGSDGLDASGHFSRIALGFFLVDGIEIESAFRTIRNVFVNDVNKVLVEREFFARSYVDRSEDKNIERFADEMNACLSVMDAAKITL